MIGGRGQEGGRRIWRGRGRRRGGGRQLEGEASLEPGLSIEESDAEVDDGSDDKDLHQEVVKLLQHELPEGRP